MIAYCTSCGNELELNDSFCPKCGNPIGATVTARSNVEAKSADQRQPGIILILLAATVLLLNGAVAFRNGVASAAEEGEGMAYVAGFTAAQVLILPLLIVGLFHLGRRFRNQRSRTKIFIWSSVVNFVVLFLAGFLWLSPEIEVHLLNSNIVGSMSVQVNLPWIEHPVYPSSTSSISFLSPQSSGNCSTTRSRSILNFAAFPKKGSHPL